MVDIHPWIIEAVLRSATSPRSGIAGFKENSKEVAHRFYVRPLTPCIDEIISRFWGIKDNNNIGVKLLGELLEIRHWDSNAIVCWHLCVSPHHHQSKTFRFITQHLNSPINNMVFRLMLRAYLIFSQDTVTTD